MRTASKRAGARRRNSPIFMFRGGQIKDNQLLALPTTVGWQWAFQ
jgi:hypothetical protein